MLIRSCVQVLEQLSPVKLPNFMANVQLDTDSGAGSCVLPSGAELGQEAISPSMKPARPRKRPIASTGASVSYNIQVAHCCLVS